MLIRKMLIPFTLLAGVAAGLLRAFEWHLAWDSELALMTPYHFMSILLLVFSLLFAGALLFVTAHGAPGRRSQSQEAAPEAAGRTLWWAGAAAVLALFVSAALDIGEFVGSLTPGGSTQGTSALLFAIFSLFSGACILLVAAKSAKGAPGQAYGFYMLVPVFWACFWLIRNISKYAINPAPLSYLYDMMATIFTLLALYAAAGFFFGRPRPRQARVYCMLGVYFSLVSLLGLGLYWILWGGAPVDFLHPGDLCRFAFAVLYLPAVACILPVWMPSEPAPVPAEDGPEEDGLAAE